MKEEIKKLQDKLITFEHGKPPKGHEPPYWGCDCWPEKRIKALLKVIKPFLAPKGELNRK